MPWSHFHSLLPTVNYGRDTRWTKGSAVRRCGRSGLCHRDADTLRPYGLRDWRNRRWSLQPPCQMVGRFRIRIGDTAHWAYGTVPTHPTTNSRCTLRSCDDVERISDALPRRSPKTATRAQTYG